MSYNGQEACDEAHPGYRTERRLILHDQKMHHDCFDSLHNTQFIHLYMNDDMLEVLPRVERITKGLRDGSITVDDLEGDGAREPGEAQDAENPDQAE